MNEKINPIDVEQYISKINFPATKNDLVNYAQDHSAPKPILSALKSIPERQYKTAADAARETFFDEDLLRGQDSCED